MSWVGALVIVVVVYLGANLVLRRFGLFSSAVTPETLRELISRRDGSLLLIDVRTAAEYRKGHIPTAINLPHDSILKRPPEVSNESVVILYGETGSRSASARRSLRRLGFERVFNFGPIRRWNGGLVEGIRPGELASNPTTTDEHPRSANTDDGTG